MLLLLIIVTTFEAKKNCIGAANIFFSVKRTKKVLKCLKLITFYKSSSNNQKTSN